jgi:hypothetical protein
MNIEIYLAALALKRRVIEGKQALWGICNQLDVPSSDTFYPWKDCYPTWEHYTGNLIYPVPGSYTHHLFNDTLWVGAQYNYRVSLLDHIISYYKPSCMLDHVKFLNFKIRGYFK